MGKSFDVTHQGHPSTSGLVQALFTGNHDVLASAAQCTNPIPSLPSPPLLLRSLTDRAPTTNRRTHAHPDFYIDVQDTARLHVAALLHPAVREERIFAYAGPYTWRTIQQTMQKLYPRRAFAPDVADAPLDGSVVPGTARAEDLLREMGREGWTSLEDCVRMNTEDLAV